MPLLVAFLLCAPAFWSGGLVGSAGAEVYGHAWVLDRAVVVWPGWVDTGVWALGGDRPVIDPLSTWVFAGLGRLVGLGWAWNLRAVVGLWLVGLGGGGFG